jgi:hypothetical protein
MGLIMNGEFMGVWKKVSYLKVLLRYSPGQISLISSLSTTGTRPIILLPLVEVTHTHTLYIGFFNLVTITVLLEKLK